MYTQCPDCDTAFRVTAEVLRQAAGKVRCGGCGIAFNALDYLSEQMPQQRAPKQAEVALPELKPDTIDPNSTPPRSISAEQSAALLKTLDELAGSDIRIEDTGVEWRVFDDDEAAAPAAGHNSAGPEPGVASVDEYLDDNPTPIDEFLTATPDVIDSPEIFENEDAGPTRTSVDELRFDDDTPLPDDFDLNDEPSYESKSSEDAPEFDQPAAAQPQADFALSEPDEWADILGEFQDLAAEVSTPVDELTDDEVAAETAAPEIANEESLSEFGTVKQPLDTDSQFALQAEAMGIDLSGIHEVEDEVEADAELPLDAADEMSEQSELEEATDVESTELKLDDVEAAFDEGLAEDLEADLLVELEAAVDETPGDEFQADLEAELDTDLDADDEPEDALEQLDLVAELEDEPDGLIDEPIVENHTIEEELAALGEDASEGDASSDPTSDTPESEHYVPPMTEDEHTVNMQIDQELMALAIEDEDGFASTIIIPDKDAEKMVAAEHKIAEADTDAGEEDSASQSGFETIIMEGEFVRSMLDEETPATTSETAEEIRKLIDANEAEQAREPGGKRWGLIGGIVVLVLVLAVQIIHQSREALATIPAFSSTVGQVYRALGQPVQPAWDITGWRFEVTNDRTEKTDSGDELLTVYSRIGNDSSNPLPYPLINISLRDRFEETIGSSILEPSAYLPEDLDPREHVKPGNSFNAVISLSALSAEATGYTLNVCYRQKDSQLRCNFEDFK